MSWFSRLCLNSQARFPSKSLFEIYAVDATLKSDSRRAVARGKEKEPQMRPLRVRVDGKHLAVAGEPFRVRGVTYGSFGTRADGAPYPEPERLEADFRAMADAGLNLVRIYTTPPPDVFEAADAAGLRLLVGVHYEDWRCEQTPSRAAHRRVRERAIRALEEAMDACAGQAVVLGISVGNEVPSDVVRVHGITSVASVLSHLVEHVHRLDAAMLATYTNYPSTEYLSVDGEDFASFNIFLESPEKLRGYLARLQVVNGDRPLVVTELGLASGVHGYEQQAQSLAWQLTSVDKAGLAGAAVFSWTDEWVVDGVSVENWGFGITDEDRRPKPALEVVRGWARQSVRDLRPRWPRVSVVVCARNEAETIEDCLASLSASDYPDLEVIVSDDGSTDETAAFAARFAHRVLRLEHGGLSRARNAGVAAASGEIVAFLDADAACHPEWPYRLVLALEEDNVAAAGGPNLPFEHAGLVERAVAAAPGGPVEVLISDDRAEHVPGCNMAFRKAALVDVGGFDPIYRAAGDDVDVCWKLLERGYEIAFTSSAQVRHHRRSTVTGYLRQQRSYGRAERLLAGRWRHRMNRLGMARWAGSLYGGPRILPSLLRPVVYHGPMGFAPFQGVVRDRNRQALSWMSALLPITPGIALLGVLALVSSWWLVAPALALVTLISYGIVVGAAVKPGRDEPSAVAFRTLTALLHLVQPLVRAWGRLHGPPAPPLPGPGPAEWNGDRAAWLLELQRELSERRCRVRVGAADVAHDLSVSVGPFLMCRIATAVVWNWTPLHRCTWRPRVAALLAAAAIGALAIASLMAACVALTLAGAVALTEYAALRRRVRAALTASAANDERAEMVPPPQLAPHPRGARA